MYAPIRVLVVEELPEQVDLLIGWLRRDGYAPEWRGASR